MIVSVDIETRCELNLADVGVYRYAEHESFKVLCIAIKVGSSPTLVYDTSHTIPQHIINAIVNAEQRWAFNAQFERVCLNRAFGVDTGDWHCTMVLGLYHGLPMSLDAAALEMGLTNNKDKAGKDLIKLFSIPNRKGGFTPTNDKAFIDFMMYCKQDVEVEYELRQSLPNETVVTLGDLWQSYWLDQRINDRGVPVDTLFVNQAIRLAADANDTDEQVLQAITGLDNPKSPKQLKDWLTGMGVNVTSTNKAELKTLKLNSDTPDIVKEALELKERLGKTSLSKYDKMAECTMKDSRIRGLLQFYGASRTGRWAGRLVQVQNLPQNHLNEIIKVRTSVLDGTLDVPNTQDVLSQLIRTSFVGEFAVCDFSAIEARVIAWLAGEQWRLDVFATHGKIYEASASQMFGIPIEQCGKGTEWRQKGKVAELALGYGGSVNALRVMNAEGTDDELQELVDVWRYANPAIVSLWKSLERLIRSCLTSNQVQKCVLPHATIFASKINGTLYVRLPSGRKLAYRGLQEIVKYGRIQLAYFGTDQATQKRGLVTTYGGKITENIIQAIARDCLNDALLKLEALGVDTVMHVHDEVVALGGQDTLDVMETVFKQPIEWANGLVLKGDGFVTPFYMKD